MIHRRMVWYFWSFSRYERWVFLEYFYDCSIFFGFPFREYDSIRFFTSDEEYPFSYLSDPIVCWVDYLAVYMIPHLSKKRQNLFFCPTLVVCCEPRHILHNKIIWLHDRYYTSKFLEKLISRIFDKSPPNIACHTKTLTGWSSNDDVDLLIAYYSEYIFWREIFDISFDELVWWEILFICCTKTGLYIERKYVLKSCSIKSYRKTSRSTKEINICWFFGHILSW